jgi:hypothetical protein
VDDATLILRQGAPRHVPLADALDEGVSPTWTETVAIVREVATQLHRGGEPHQVPAVEDIAILSNGGVLLSGGRPYPGGAVAGVGVVMSQLLEQVSAPQQVMDVQHQAIASPPVFATLIDFHNALDFYARPDPQGVLADYFTRATAAVDVGSKNRALEALKEKTKSAHPRDEKKKSARNKRPAYVAVAALLVAGLAGLAAYGLLGASSSTSAVGQTANAALAAITDTGKKLQDATNNAVSKLVGGATEAAPAPANSSPAEATAVTPAIRRRAPVPSEKTPVAATTPRAPAVTPSPVAPGAAAPRPSAAVDIPPIDTNVYTAASADVVPPELVYPQLPTQRKEDATLSVPGDLDLLILEDGTVGEALLIPQSNRLQDRMMISAAKAWRFRAAQKDGRPVRYRVRIPITW